MAYHSNLSNAMADGWSTTFALANDIGAFQRESHPTNLNYILSPHIPSSVSWMITTVFVRLWTLHLCTLVLLKCTLSKMRREQVPGGPKNPRGENSRELLAAYSAGGPTKLSTLRGFETWSPTTLHGPFKTQRQKCIRNVTFQTSRKKHYPSVRNMWIIRTEINDLLDQTGHLGCVS